MGSNWLFKIPIEKAWQNTTYLKQSEGHLTIDKPSIENVKWEIGRQNAVGHGWFEPAPEGNRLKLFFFKFGKKCRISRFYKTSSAAR